MAARRAMSGCSQGAGLARTVAARKARALSGLMARPAHGRPRPVCRTAGPYDPARNFFLKTVAFGLVSGGIDGALEAVEQVEHGGVGEGEDLGEDHAGDAAGRVDPVVRVRQAGPGQAAGAPTGGRLFSADHVPEAPLLDHAGEELGIVRAARHAGLEQANGELADLVSAHLCDGLGPQHAGLTELATTQQHALEVEIVWPGRVQPAAAHEKLGRLRNFERDRLERAVRQTRVHPGQPRALVAAHHKAAVAHAEGTEDVLLEVRLERLPAEALDGLADPVDIDA